MSRTSTRDRFSPTDRIGDYRVERELRREASGVVYVGAHLVLPRRAALKVTHPGEDRTVAVQVLREACILEALSHPGIPRVYECGMLDDRRPWSAQEHIEGSAIADVPMPVADLVTLIRDVAELLAHAHGRGIVHGAIDRDAMVLTPGARFPVCLRNWGDARTVDSDRALATDPRDDIRMLGELVFEVLIGARVGAVSAADTCPSAPAELTALLDRMLADPDQRPTAAEIQQQTTWLATTIELVPSKPRWTPPLGIGDRVPADDAQSTFQIRISRTTTS